ncbi:MAG: CAF17-like 4Fe-4S cluster assembly/insertion protein YgfZ [Acidimicrobiales bacterium]
MSTSIAVAEVQRDVLRISGPDAISYLQGQLSQDIAALAVGDSAFSLLLAPQGKIDAYLRVTRTDDETLLLDVDAGWAEAVVARLERFKLRVKCTIEVLDDWLALAVRTPDVDAVKSWALANELWPGVAEIPGAGGIDVLGPRAVLKGAIEHLEPLTELDPFEYEAMRIEGGVPRMGSELSTSTIPAEAGVVQRSASFTKGCYTGQELVARLDARGNKVPRLLRLVIIETDESGAESLPKVGSALVVEHTDVGSLTSVAWSSKRAAGVALAYVRREVNVPSVAIVNGPDPTTQTWKARVELCISSD